jgi:hypothetical protein
MKGNLTGFTPLLQPDLASGLEALAQLLQRSLLGYQTLTVLFETPGTESDSKNLPALMVSRLPSEDWILELPLPPLNKSASQPKFEFFIFNGWLAPGETIGASFSCGPKKLIHEADSKTFSAALLSAVEDLLLVSGNLDASKILIADNENEVTDSLGKQIKKVMTQFPGVVGILPATSNFFGESDQSDTQNQEELKQLALASSELEVLISERNLSFFATTCYTGVPRNLFVLDSSKENPRVLVWNGRNFVPCEEDHIVKAIQMPGDVAQPGRPTELPAIYASKLWPDAIKRLDLPIRLTDEEQ